VSESFKVPFTILVEWDTKEAEATAGEAAGIVADTAGVRR
jgi:hypothetical protein